jgi:hypothetical protein
MKVDWHTQCSLSDNHLDSKTLLFIYTSDEGNLPVGYDECPQVAIDGVFVKLDLTNLDKNYKPYITKAKKVIFTKYFYNMTNQASTWYTISLPFKPTRITSKENVLLTPFDSNISGANNFWLRELTPDGFKDVTEMEANHPYIIAMPQSSMYNDEYNIYGTVTFSAENVAFNDDCWESYVAEGPTFNMYTNYGKIGMARNIYALNSLYWVDEYEYGQVFVHSAIDVNPYEAYVKLNDGGTTMRSLLPVDNKRTAVRGVSSSNKASSRGAYGHRKPQKDDM